jgi:hypothetical protein
MGKPGVMAAVQRGTVPAVRRADAGTVRLTQRDISGLLLCAEHYAAPYDLLAAALSVAPARVRAVTARWRAAGLAETGTLGPGPAWCWLTPAGIAACGRDYPSRPPSLSRLAHIRAVLAARLWLESGDAYQSGRAWWRSERRLRAALPANVGTAHVADAEIHWPSVEASAYVGQVWCVEVELTPKTAARTARIVSGLLSGPYAQVVYLCSPPARPVVARTAANLPESQRARIAVRDLPAAAYMAGVPRP